MIRKGISVIVEVDLTLSSRLMNVECDTIAKIGQRVLRRGRRDERKIYTAH